MKQSQTPQQGRVFFPNPKIRISPFSSNNPRIHLFETRFLCTKKTIHMLRIHTKSIVVVTENTLLAKMDGFCVKSDNNPSQFGNKRFYIA